MSMCELRNDSKREDMTEVVVACNKLVEAKKMGDYQNTRAMLRLAELIATRPGSLDLIRQLQGE